MQRTPVVLAVLLGVVGLQVLVRADPPAAPVATRWEYLVLDRMEEEGRGKWEEYVKAGFAVRRAGEDAPQYLARFGADGWELVTTEGNAWTIFKRRRR